MQLLKSGSRGGIRREDFRFSKTKEKKKRLRI